MGTSILGQCMWARGSLSMSKMMRFLARHWGWITGVLILVGTILIPHQPTDMDFLLVLISSILIVGSFE